MSESLMSSLTAGLGAGVSIALRSIPALQKRRLKTDFVLLIAAILGCHCKQSRRSECNSPGL